MPAATRSDVNNAPLIQVDAVSVTLARDNSYRLLLRTSSGVGQFSIPLAVGDGVFRITNPAVAYVPKVGRAPMTKPNGRLL